MARWSSPKDPALEAALRRNRRWIVNNQIKRLLLRFPSRSAPVRFLQSRFKTLDLLGRAANWLRKYPSCFELFDGDGSAGSVEEPCFGFTKRMAELVDAEEAAVAASEPAMADRLARVLMLARGRRLQVSKLAALRGPLGLPDDYLLRLLPARTDLFRLANPYPHRRNAAELELLRWVPSLAVSAVEATASASSSPPRFTCSLPPSWAKSHGKMEEFNSTPYISPYSEAWAVLGTDAEAEKRAIAVVHELLSLTLWRKMSVLKLEHFRREFGLPEDTARMLLRHPCLFYVSNRYKIHTVVLREGYDGSELREKDPVVVAKDRLGELMQEGLHEYNQRRCAANLEKRRRKGEFEVKEEEEDDDVVARLDSADKREERRRFYKEEGEGPLVMLKPRFSSSLYSWHSAQLPQQKCTQQSKQGDSCKLYCCLIEERLVQEYNQWQDMDASRTYRVPFMQHAGNKESAIKINDFLCLNPSANDKQSTYMLNPCQQSQQCGQM